MKTVRTDERRTAFLNSLSGCGNVSTACTDARIGRTAAYGWRKTDAAFAAAWDEAQELGTDALEDEATRRASEGTLKPVFYQGAECGHVREYSDTLMIFLLKARRPERFKERVANEFSGSLQVGDTIDRPPNETREEWIARRQGNCASAPPDPATNRQQRR